MKKLTAVLLCLAALLSVPVCADAREAPDVSAGAYVLYCAENGEVLAGKNEHARMKPASTTKLMTTLLTLEVAAKNDEVATDDAAEPPGIP